MSHEDDTMWKAVCDNDNRYDGEFFYGVKTTGIFCRPSCKSKQPLRNNVVYFEDAYEAVKAGFRPCKRCRPDLLTQQEEPAKEICKRVTAILKEQYCQPDIHDQLPELIRVSPYYLQRLYKKLTGYTPKTYLQQVRIEEALKLLEKSDMNNTDICYAVGFQSLSRFYAAFREVTGMSPRNYRQKCSETKMEEAVDENCI